MTTTDLDIRIIDWLGDADSADVDVVTFGALTLRAGEVVLTEVEDLLARTTRDSIRVSLNRLARWFTDGWWRLRWEPLPAERSSSFNMAHQLAAAGGGFVWPNLSIVSDGERLTITARPTTERHTIRYLRAHEAQVSALSFERSVDGLVSRVLSRQRDLGVVDDELHEAWEALRDERRDPEASAFRKREALMGLNPGEVDADTLDALFRAGEEHGADALEELLVGTSPEALASWLQDLSALKQEPLTSIRVDAVLDAAKGWAAPTSTVEAWQIGGSLARHLRAQWGLGSNEPLSDERLNDLVHADIHADSLSRSPKPFSVAFREGHSLRPVLKRTNYRTSRRFDVARLIADAAVAPLADSLLPLTRARTARQRLQRAAAQELLCPVEGLRARLHLPDPDEDEVLEAAAHYNVSEKVVRTALVNKHLVPRAFGFND